MLVLHLNLNEKSLTGFKSIVKQNSLIYFGILRPDKGAMFVLSCFNDGFMFEL
jgi:hypothetical protein